MYKIQNIGAGRVPLQLPKGCITLESGAYLDLDDHAPRSWIRTNFDLNALLRGEVLRLVHDSVNDRVPTQPTKPVVKNVVEKISVPKQVAPKQQSTVIDLSAEEDPSEDHFTIVEDLTVTDDFEEDPEEDLKEDPEEDPVEQAIMEEIDDD